MQNRESAIRNRQKKKENFKTIEADMDYLKIENVRLRQENEFLKNERVFLVDQIKFMQNLIKSHNLILVSNSHLNVNQNSTLDFTNNSEKKSTENINKKNNDIEKNIIGDKNHKSKNNLNDNRIRDNSSTNSESNNSIIENDKNNLKCDSNQENIKDLDLNENKIYLNGKNQKKIGKMFSIFIICLLGILYISNADVESNEKIIFNNNSIMNLNEYNDAANTSFKLSNYYSYLLHIFILILLILMYFPICLIVKRIIQYVCVFFKEKKLKFVKNL